MSANDCCDGYFKLFGIHRPGCPKGENMNANEFLAINLMEWEIREVKGINGTIKYCFAPTTPVMMLCEWRPDIDLNQAFEVVEKMVKVGWYYELGLAQREGHDCLFFMRGIEKTFRCEHKNPATAITLAAAKALGWKE